MCAPIEAALKPKIHSHSSCSMLKPKARSMSLPPLPIFQLGCLAALCTCVPFAAQAQITPLGDPPVPQALADQPLVWRAGLQWQRDDNVLRSSQAPLADRIGVASVGVRLDQTYGRQRVELDAQLEGYRYDRASQLDFNALNYLAAWNWGLGPQWSGRLSLQRRQFVDRFGQTTADSGLIRRIESSESAQAGYRLGAGWQALAGLYARRQDQNDPAEPDLALKGAELGLRYSLPSDSKLAYWFRQGRGEYSGAAWPAGAGDFDEAEHALELGGLLSDRLRINGQMAYLQREHQQLSERDFSGLVARVGLNWALSAKTSLGAGLVRELAAYQSSDASYFEGYRGFVAPQWQASPKTSLRLRFEGGQRQYKGAPAGAPVGVPSRRDTLQMASLELQWQALRQLSLSATVQRDERRSNQPGAQYRARIVALSAQAGF
jgi:exopolysaccharide biosynthesis operon protein EpsL